MKPPGVGGSGSTPRASSAASASKAAPSAVGCSPQSRNAEGARGSGGRDSAESNCGNDSDAMPPPDTSACSFSRRNATKPAAAEGATSEAVDSLMDAPKSRGTAIAAQGEESNARGVGRSFGARGLLGGSRAASRGGSSSSSTAAGRGHEEVYSSDGGEGGGAVAAATTTRGRVGMRKARRTYGR